MSEIHAIFGQMHAIFIALHDAAAVFDDWVTLGYSRPARSASHPVQQIENSINTILESNGMVDESWKELSTFNLEQFRDNYVKTIDVILKLDE